MMSLDRAGASSEITSPRRGEAKGTRGNNLLQPDLRHLLLRWLCRLCWLHEFYRLHPLGQLLGQRSGADIVGLAGAEQRYLVDHADVGGHREFGGADRLGL